MVFIFHQQNIHIHKYDNNINISIYTLCWKKSNNDLFSDDSKGFVLIFSYNIGVYIL